MTPLKWKERMKVQDDKNQTIIAPNDKTGCKFKGAPQTTITYAVNDPVMCPFCLHTSFINAFLKSSKKGFDKRLGECPECQQGMMLKTLTAEWTPEQFAQWCYEYSASGFWQKVTFKKFTDRLYQMGWSYRFWAKYKELKGPTDEEASYEQYQKDQEPK